jgi:hypothetical protein
MLLEYAHIGVQHHKKGLTMSLMEHLPRSDWSDVARTRDIEFIDKRLGMIEKRLNVCITVGLACGLALVALQVQIMLSVSHL